MTTKELVSLLIRFLMWSLFLHPNWMEAKFNSKKHNTMNYEVKEVGIGPNNTTAVPISAIDDALNDLDSILQWRESILNRIVKFH